MIGESDDDVDVINNVGDNNFNEDSSELDDEMVTGSINDNFNNVFYFPARINLHIFLAEQVASVLSWVSYFSESHPVSIKYLSYKPQVIVTKHSLLDVFES